MEEILSSIKRIIAEEGDEGVSAPRAPRRGRGEPVVALRDDVLVADEPAAAAATLELVAPEADPAGDDAPEAVQEDDVIELTPPMMEAADSEPVADEVLELTEEIDKEEVVSSTNAAASAKSGPDSILSVESEVAARHSLSALSSMIVTPETGASNTLEGLVRSMLRPMLKEWLDAHLPEMVESMVAKEIARITGSAR